MVIRRVNTDSQDREGGRVFNDQVKPLQDDCWLIRLLRSTSLEFKHVRNHRRVYGERCVVIRSRSNIAKRGDGCKVTNNV